MGPASGRPAGEPDRFDAVETVRTGLADSAADLDQLVAAALGGGARVVYPAAGGGWVTAQGHEVTPADAYVDVRRHDELMARVEYDPERNDAEVVEAVAAAAAPEIDNVALRAELARQIEVVTESRARLATAHLDERSRIERDLHDGAQQRLLAIALQLQAARVNGDPAVLTRDVDRAVVDLGELSRSCAPWPPACNRPRSCGLLAAVIDLAGRIPLRVDFDVVDRRFPARIEAAAWFVIARRWPTWSSTRGPTRSASQSRPPTNSCGSSSPTAASAAPTSTDTASVGSPTG